MSRHFLNPYKRHNPPLSWSCLYESRCWHSSQVNHVTDQDTSACGVRITTDDMAGAFVVLCEPQVAKLRNYCPYSERSSRYKSLHTLISGCLSISLHHHIPLYMYLHQWCVPIPITLPLANQKSYMKSATFQSLSLYTIRQCRSEWDSCTAMA